MRVHALTHGCCWTLYDAEACRYYPFTANVVWANERPPALGFLDGSVVPQKSVRIFLDRRFILVNEVGDSSKEAETTGNIYLDDLIEAGQLKPLSVSVDDLRHGSAYWITGA